MLSNGIPVREVPGTKVLLVKRNEGNPARERKDFKLFRNGYWEVHVSSSGDHPHFKKGLWKILLVTPSQEKIEFSVDDIGLWFIPIAPTANPAEIVTTIERVNVDGLWWQFPGLIITLSDRHEVRFQCAQEEMMGPRTLN